MAFPSLTARKSASCPTGRATVGTGPAAAFAASDVREREGVTPSQKKDKTGRARTAVPGARRSERVHLDTALACVRA